MLIEGLEKNNVPNYQFFFNISKSCMVERYKNYIFLNKVFQKLFLLPETFHYPGQEVFSENSLKIVFIEQATKQ